MSICNDLRDRKMNVKIVICDLYTSALIEVGGGVENLVMPVSDNRPWLLTELVSGRLCK